MPGIIIQINNICKIIYYYPYLLNLFTIIHIYQIIYYYLYLLNYLLLSIFITIHIIIYKLFVSFLRSLKYGNHICFINKNNYKSLI
jgi:hypothetical protein